MPGPGQCRRTMTTSPAAMVLHRQRHPVPDHPDHGARRRSLADRHRRGQPELGPATGRRRNHHPMTVQLLAIDGVTVHAAAGHDDRARWSRWRAASSRWCPARTSTTITDGPGLRRRDRHDAGLARRSVGHLPRCRPARITPPPAGATAHVAEPGLTMGIRRSLAAGRPRQGGVQPDRRAPVHQPGRSWSTDSGLTSTSRAASSAPRFRSAHRSDRGGAAELQPARAAAGAITGASSLASPTSPRTIRSRSATRKSTSTARSFRDRRSRIRTTRQHGAIRSLDTAVVSAARSGPDAGDRRPGNWFSSRPRTTISTSTRPGLR